MISNGHGKKNQNREPRRPFPFRYSSGGRKHKGPLEVVARNKLGIEDNRSNAKFHEIAK
jgi:hypothetical protein